MSRRASSRSRGAISGSANLTKAGNGTLVLGGGAPNDYTGTTTVIAGTLQLSDTGGAAMDGPLVIGDGTDTALVQETASYQIGSGSTSIRVNPSGSFGLDGHNDVIGSLTLDAGTVFTGTGTLNAGRRRHHHRRDKHGNH